MKKNKYQYLKVIQAYIPNNGWCDYSAYDKNNADEMREMKDDLRDYRDNEPYSFRVVSRRLPADVTFHA